MFRNKSYERRTTAITGRRELIHHEAGRRTPLRLMALFVGVASQNDSLPQTTSTISRPGQNGKHFLVGQRSSCHAISVSMALSTAWQSRRQTQAKESTLSERHRHQFISDAKHEPKRAAFVAERTFQRIFSRRKTSTEASDQDGRTIAQQNDSRRKTQAEGHDVIASTIKQRKHPSRTSVRAPIVSLGRPTND
jgi:hypothetical protein